MLRADELDPSAHFVAAHSQAVLAVTGAGDLRVAVLSSPAVSQRVAYTVWNGDKTDLSPVAVTSGVLPGSSEPEPFVLSCDADHSHCEALRGHAGETQLQSFSANPFPEGFIAQGLIVDGSASPVTLCAYGNGIVCFDESWKTTLALDAGLTLRSVAIGAVWSLAVGDDGRWYKRERQDSGDLGAWEAQSALGQAKLSQASVAGLGGIILGEGRVQAALGSAQSSFACQPPVSLFGVILHEGIPGSADVVTSDGKILQHTAAGSANGPYCTRQDSGADMLLGVASAPCGASMNPRLLTSAALLGQYDCPIL